MFTLRDLAFDFFLEIYQLLHESWIWIDTRSSIPHQLESLFQTHSMCIYQISKNTRSGPGDSSVTMNENNPIILNCFLHENASWLKMLSQVFPFSIFHLKHFISKFVQKRWSRPTHCLNNMSNTATLKCTIVIWGFYIA